MLSGNFMEVLEGLRLLDKEARKFGQRLTDVLSIPPFMAGIWEDIARAGPERFRKELEKLERMPSIAEQWKIEERTLSEIFQKITANLANIFKTWGVIFAKFAKPALEGLAKAIEWFAKLLERQDIVGQIVRWGTAFGLLGVAVLSAVPPTLLLLKNLFGLFRITSAVFGLTEAIGTFKNLGGMFRFVATTVQAPALAISKLSTTIKLLGGVASKVFAMISSSALTAGKFLLTAFLPFLLKIGLIVGGIVLLYEVVRKVAKLFGVHLPSSLEIAKKALDWIKEKVLALVEKFQKLAKTIVGVFRIVKEKVFGKEEGKKEKEKIIEERKVEEERKTTLERIKESLKISAPSIPAIPTPSPAPALAGGGGGGNVEFIINVNVNISEAKFGNGEELGEKIEMIIRRRVIPELRKFWKDRKLRGE